MTAHWVSKLLDRRWQIDVLTGLHNEYLYDRSPYSALNSLNELQYGGEPLGPRARLRLPADRTTNFQPCPVSPYYKAGGFGEVDRVHCLPLVGRGQVDPHHRGRRPQRAEVRLAPGDRHLT